MKIRNGMTSFDLVEGFSSGSCYSINKLVHVSEGHLVKTKLCQTEDTEKEIAP